ncbi:RBCC1-like protein [Mya arenaria]|uniref:RBCC1-like protein n=1 Tax=Mya arenaria TaxID=6604 RepID=A0ABY7FRL2_MYAAR|nr:RBCC1-like protein [Mya arenaria]
MLYVFHVDTGTMMTFDMNLAMERVISLQNVIARGCRIAEDKQVLLISGGESLDPSAVVGKYHAGTDTNPIFLFSKSTIESAIPPSPSVNYGSDIDLQAQVEGSLLMPPAYETVVSRTQLALQFQEVDGEELGACEKLIHDQHLQQQGWAAVVANLEDVTGELRQRWETFNESFQQYLECRESYRDLIASVSKSLNLLSKIPVLSALTNSQDGTDNSSGSGGVTTSLSRSTLFDWISSQDVNHTLHDMVEQCGKATEQLDGKVADSLKEQVEHMLAEVENESMKAVKGLEDRLYGLDQIISGARKILQEQADLAKGFVQNQNRVSNLRDRSILPDLCSSHRNQLMEMSKNHTRLREIKKKCRMAKEELSINLHTRLRWVMYIEKKICDVDGKLTIYLGNLRRLRKRLDILQQVQDAPRVYGQLITEVWAGSLAEDSGRLHTEEMKRREAFLRIIGHHFLQSMFTGFDDYPPAFATVAPEGFDMLLPEITGEDLKLLKEAVPELSGVLSEPVEDDWLLFTAVKDASALWEAETTPSLHTLTQATSMKTVSGERLSYSEGSSLQPYSIDNGSKSLGDQFEECMQDEDITKKPEFISFSPPNDEFLLAKSLSEELTQDMRETNSRIKKAVGTVDVIEDLQLRVGMPGSPTAKPSPLPHPPVKTRKSLPEMSPDMETSQEFATADFYIDESMPSSIESPPKPCSETKSSTEDCLAAEKQSNIKLLQELKECNTKLSENEQNLKTLRSIICDSLPSLRQSACDLKQNHSEYVQNVLSEVQSVRKSMLDQLEKLDANKTASEESMMGKLNEDHSKELKELCDKFDCECAKVSELEKTLQEIEQDKKKVEEELQSQVKQLQKEKIDIGVKLASDVKDLTLQHELELEVEIDKAKSELLVKLASLEKDIEAKDNVIKEKESAIKAIETEKVKSEELLMDKFQKEKETICGILGAEYDEKLEKAVQEKEEQMQTMKDSVITELTEKHEKEVQKQLDELKQKFSTEKEEVVEMTQSTLCIEHAKETDEIKQVLIKEKDEEIAQLKKQLEAQYDEMIGKLKSEKDKLEKELKKYEDKSMSESTIQTDWSVFRLKQDETQTDDVSVFETHVQTDSQSTMASSMQTEAKDQKDCVMQTSSAQMTSSVQTEDISQDSEATKGEKQCSKCGFQTAELRETSDESSSDVESAIKKTVQAEFDQRICDLEACHNAEISELISKLEKEKEDAQQLKSSLTSMTGDKQVEESLKLAEEKSKAEGIKERALSLLETKEREFGASHRALESELGLTRQQVAALKDQLAGVGSDSEGAAAVSPSVEQISDPEQPDLYERIKTLEEMELSMTASTRSLIQDKVSITSCHVGDLVLLCLDERLDQYVVFTVGSTLHFLHTDCLPQLGLKSETGDQKKQWLIAEVVDKEYCQAKKANNRFKVPVGTKFYRVKAKKWTRETGHPSPRKPDTPSASSP